MALPTIAWDENNPLGSQAISLGDDRIREMKTQVREVVGVDHIFASSGSGGTTGYHNQLTLVEQASKPTTYTTNQIALYGKEVSSKTELFLVDEAGTEHQLTSNYLLNLATVTGALAIVNGGTNLTGYTQGDLLYASATDTLAKLAKNTTATRYLSNTGTFNAPAWDQINIINGLKIASQAQGDIIFADSTTTFARLGPGTSGYFLKTQGAGANPIWAAIPQSGLSLTSTTTISGANTTGSISITTGKIYYVMFSFVNFTNNGNLLWIRFNGDSGTHYKYTSTGNTATNSTITFASASAAQIQLGRGTNNGSTTGIQGGFYIQQLGTSQKYQVWGQILMPVGSTSGSLESITTSGTWTNSADVTSFALICDNSDNMSGTVYLYEVATS